MKRDAAYWLARVDEYPGGAERELIAAMKKARPHTYRAYDELLARKDPQLTKMIATALAPGGALYDAKPADVELVVAASKSKHVPIRKDAALALGSFKTVKARKQAVPFLVELLADKDAHVRRLALMSLADCKSAARPALPQIRAKLQDRNKSVRSFAEGTLERLGER